MVYDPDCSIPSAPCIATTTEDPSGTPMDPVLAPIPTNERSSIRSGRGIGPWFLLKATSRVVLRGDGHQQSCILLDVSGIRNGTYWFRLMKDQARSVVIQR